MSEFEERINHTKFLNAASVDSEDQTIRSAASSDTYGDVLPDAWESLDAVDDIQYDAEINSNDLNGNDHDGEKGFGDGEGGGEEGEEEEDEEDDDGEEAEVEDEEAVEEEEDEDEEEEEDEDEEEGDEEEDDIENDEDEVHREERDESKGQQDPRKVEESAQDSDGDDDEEEEDDDENGDDTENKPVVDHRTAAAELTLATSSEVQIGGDENEAEDEEEGEEEEEEGDDEDEEVDDELSSEDDEGNIDDENFHCDMTLPEIQQEIRELAELVHKGMQISERRMDYLLKAQEHNPEYRAQQDEENEEWLDSIEDFTVQCLERTRTFIPVNVFSSTQDSLVNMGLSEELAKRILQRKCLWLVRMSSAEIAGLHQADLYGRFNSTAQHMDIIETAAIYASLPRRFNNDKHGKKREWRKTIEDNLKQMLVLNDNDELPAGKIRNAFYAGLQYGPIKDTESVRENHITTNAGEKEAFKDICRTNSILRDMKEI